MIQRIQSIYLFFATASYVLLFFFSVFSITLEDGAKKVEMNGWQITTTINAEEPTVETEIQILPLVLLSLLILLSLTTIFFFKKRLLQQKFCRFLLLLGSGFIVSLVFVYDNLNTTFTGEPTYHYFIALAILPLFLFLLANKAIIKDEKLVRSMDRLR
ncbi:MAG: DUF4293 domain-containing protein [Bacteroidota bacterium]|nr:DUF4293 domain-containing protein [Bacteroidota bacterium]